MVVHMQCLKSINTSVATLMELRCQVAIGLRLASHVQEIFAENLARIEKHNAGKHSYQLGVTEFADKKPSDAAAKREGTCGGS